MRNSEESVEEQTVFELLSAENLHFVHKKNLHSVHKEELLNAGSDGRKWEF